MNTAILATLIISRIAAEIGFYLADQCGRKRTARAKRIGNIAWRVARVCSSIGGISDAYIKKKYQGRS